MGARWLARFRGRCVWEVRRGRGGGREAQARGGRAICWKAAVAVRVRGWQAEQNVVGFSALLCPTPSLENGSVPGMQRQAFLSCAAAGLRAVRLAGRQI